jgi:arabinogalactan endo-1,4-beta-galactosidase
MKTRGTRGLAGLRANGVRERSRIGAMFAAAHLILLLPHCGGSSEVPPGVAGAAGSSAAGANAGGSSGGRGGAAGRAGNGSAGKASAGDASGGEASGGEASAGEASGGEASAGEASGGEPSGGRDPSGGRGGAGGQVAGAGNGTSGGSAAGGTSAGSAGTTAGTAGSGGSEPVLRPDFLLGADISGVHEAIEGGAVFVDTDAVQKPIAGLLAAHGFNSIRLRTFVAPGNLYGYANPTGEATYMRAEPYCDRDHTVEFGKQMKDAGMKLLVDLHYSDNWADPGKQIIPEAWRDVQTIEELGAEVRAYTQDLVQAMVDGGARPDIVQLGNEIAPGMLLHVPGANPNPDQWGNINMVVNPINGSSSNWANLGLLLREGVAGVHAVDPSIRIMLHLANTTSPNAITTFLQSARAEGVDFDILGLSCYVNWHGPPSFWQNTFNTLASRFTDLDFVIAEYGPEARRANEIVRDIVDQRGLGTFVWEPTESGVWGPSMFTRSGNTYRAISEAFAVYDGIRADFGLP